MNECISNAGLDICIRSCSGVSSQTKQCYSEQSFCLREELAATTPSDQQRLSLAPCELKLCGFVSKCILNVCVFCMKLQSDGCKPKQTKSSRAAAWSRRRKSCSTGCNSCSLWLVRNWLSGTKSYKGSFTVLRKWSVGSLAMLNFWIWIQAAERKAIHLLPCVIVRTVGNFSRWLVWCKSNQILLWN